MALPQPYDPYYLPLPLMEYVCDDPNAINTLFVSSLPDDVKACEIHNLFRRRHGFKSCQLKYTGRGYQLHSKREGMAQQWALAQRTLHGLQTPEASNIFNEKSSYRELSDIAEQAKRRAEIARLRELHTLKGPIQQHYTV